MRITLQLANGKHKYTLHNVRINASWLYIYICSHAAGFKLLSIAFAHRYNPSNARNITIVLYNIYSVVYIVWFAFLFAYVICIKLPFIILIYRAQCAPRTQLSGWCNAAHCTHGHIIALLHIFNYRYTM